VVTDAFVGMFECLTHAASHVDGKPHRQRIAGVAHGRDELSQRYPVDEVHGKAAIVPIGDYVVYTRNAVMPQLHRAARALGECFENDGVLRKVRAQLLEDDGSSRKVCAIDFRKPYLTGSRCG
jgi:hypothetical protein